MKMRGALRDRIVVAPNTEDLADELVTLANAEGGAVVVGVADSGFVQGLPPAPVDQVEEWLVERRRPMTAIHRSGRPFARRCCPEPMGRMRPCYWPTFQVGCTSVGRPSGAAA